MTPEEKKEAKRLYDIEYRKNNKKKIQEAKRLWYENNPDIVKKATIRNKDNKKLADKKYAQKNKDILNQKKRKWALNNKEKITKAKTDYVKRKLKEDVLYRLKSTITSAIKQSFKRSNYTKKSRTHDILGCSYESFKSYLESKFEPWMTWDNKGNWNGIPTEINIAWDIDHIIPISSAKTEDDVIRLNHYTNLQPLCSYYNRNIKKDQY